MNNEENYAALRKSAIKIIEAFEQTVGDSRGPLTLRSEKRGRRRGKNIDVRVSTLLLGFASEVVTYSGTILEVVDKGRPLEAIPMIRAAYEAGVIAQWVEMVGADAAIAVTNEYQRKRSALSRTLQESKSEVLRNAAPTIAGASASTMPSHSNAQAKSFEALTRDFLNGKEIYVYYRMMSDYAHPGIGSIDQYFQPPSDGQATPVFSYQPRQPDRSLWFYFSVLSLCTAVRPLAKMIPDSHLIRAVDEVSTEHSFPVHLQKSPECQKRLQAARRTRYEQQKQEDDEDS